MILPGTGAFVSEGAPEDRRRLSRMLNPRGRCQLQNCALKPDCGCFAGCLRGTSLGFQWDSVAGGSWIYVPVTSSPGAGVRVS